LEETEERIQNLVTRKETIDRVVELDRRADEVATEIEQTESKKENKVELLNAQREQRKSTESTLTNVRERLQSSDPERLDSRIRQLRGFKQRVEDDRGEAKQTKEDISNKISTIESRLETVRELKERRRNLEETVQDATNLLTDVKDLIDAYEETKAELRKENVELINAYANDVFQQIYQNESYSQLTVDSSYNITLKKADGTEIDPTLSSGGESALVNIAIRAGIYRVIAERTQSTTSDTLPPFILDEPTTYLDNGHVDTLGALIRTIKQWDTEQVLLVSHDDQLIDGADTIYHIEKDSTTDTSSCSIV
jgi:exonuclease SbcC